MFIPVKFTYLLFNVPAAGKFSLKKIKGSVFVNTSDGDSYPLQDLSSGAKEQVLIALRLGIAQKISRGNSLFILLDDAFQYSDWNRRKSLIDFTVNLVKNNWQAVYFTMDDNILYLFKKYGDKLNDQFKVIEI